MSLSESMDDDDDANDAKIASKRLKEIAAKPELAIGGDDLKARLAALVA